ncbi:MAG: cytochrome P450 [Pseudomonadota bacterium]
MTDDRPQQPQFFDGELSNAEIRARWSIDADECPTQRELAELDPGNGNWFAQNKELQVFERLRREAPVHYTADSQFGSYWSISKFEDVKFVDTHQQLFSSDIMNGGIRLGGRPLSEPPPDLFHLPMFIMQDQPLHDEQRKVVAPMFTSDKLAAMGDLIRERAREILDALPRGQSFNWVREVSVELTGRILATLFDVPQEDRHKLIHWSDTVERIGDPEYFATPAEGFAEIWKCFEYFSGFWQERQKDTTPGTDLISFLAHGESTRNMKPNEFLGNVLLLIVGGNDTTRNSMTGGVQALSMYPDQFDKLKAKPALIPNMVSEIIRWQSPVAHMCRTAMEDVELGGQTIRKWDKLAIWYLSGNRDDAHWENPNRLDIERKSARQHLSFGYGIHRCLGNRLAEMQLRILWEEILTRFEHVEVVGEAQYLNSSFIRGITDLPVVVHAK